MTDRHTPAPAYARHDTYFRKHNLPTPCLLFDLDVVSDNIDRLREALPQAEIYYAVKANAEPGLLNLLAESGCCFDVASPGEIDLCLAAGADPGRISYGNTVKKAKDIAYAYERGVRMFAVDSAEELDKLASAAPGAQVICRVTVVTSGAQWPISRKFGCSQEDGIALLRRARDIGLQPYGVTFHVGSQQRNPESWDEGVGIAAELFAELSSSGIELELLNLGGGLPAGYDAGVPALEAYGKAIRESLGQHFPDPPRLIIEPGRYLPAEAGMVRSEVVLVTRRSEPVEKRWVYVDAGRFGGFAETEGEAIRFPLSVSRNGAPVDSPAGSAVLAGPTCDSADVLYEQNPRSLPLDLRPGDHIDFLAAGAYTIPYASVGFNGFPPLPAYCFSGEV
ncbi:type III PLP-dependent enzyme [Streptomyces sioyaensis]|uniref:type III PLP-dependent enzyme n=1 Tax=Streptomyces sioyaensis TaxID=67364 RepID=UPI001F1AB977|nr:type III PLP-dependent enzyme [Streptomyces sioyaensis]MCF3172197.1 type III PLP-dependent enzyme [Streptomyces sioyaensis]